MKKYFRTELEDIGTESAMKHMQASKEEALSFVRNTLNTLPVEKIVPTIESFNPSFRADIALILIEQGDGALVFQHLNGVFADVDRHDLARTLIKTGQINILAEHLHYFKKGSFNMHVASSLIQAGYGDQVMSMPGIFSCPLDDLKFAVELENMHSEREETISFMKEIASTLPAKEIISKIKSLNVSIRADMASVLVEQGDGALVLPHLNDIFVSTNQHDLAKRLIDMGQIDVLAEHLHYFKKRSLDIHTAGALIQAGYKDQVMSMPGIFLCPFAELNRIATLSLRKYLKEGGDELKAAISWQRDREQRDAA